MANWKNTIDLTAHWNESPPDIVGICKDAVNGLKSIIDLSGDLEYIRDELIDEFTSLIEDECDDVEEFDFVLTNLYDFGDIPLDDDWPTAKVAWIKTF